jgi:hypothetical protein
MFTFEFIRRLKKLNRDLYLSSRGNKIDESHVAVGLYLRGGDRDESFYSEHDKNLADSEMRRAVDELQQGARDKYLCAVPAGWVPEYSELSPSGKILARGWRAIVLILVHKKILDIHRARRVFGGSLGESDFDRLPYNEQAKRLQDGI